MLNKQKKPEFVRNRWITKIWEFLHSDNIVCAMEKWYMAKGLTIAACQGKVPGIWSVNTEKWPVPRITANIKFDLFIYFCCCDTARRTGCATDSARAIHRRRQYNLYLFMTDHSDHFLSPRSDIYACQFLGNVLLTQHHTIGCANWCHICQFTKVWWKLSENFVLLQLCFGSDYDRKKHTKKI